MTQLAQFNNKEQPVANQANRHFNDDGTVYIGLRSVAIYERKADRSASSSVTYTLYTVTVNADNTASAFVTMKDDLEIGSTFHENQDKDF